VQQLKINLDRGFQLGLLRDVQLPMLPKAVLRVIDDSGSECFKCQDTIAGEVGVKRRETVGRAIAELTRLSLITVDLKKSRYGKVTNHYRVVWNELELLVARQRNQSQTRQVITALNDETSRVQSPPSDVTSALTDVTFTGSDVTLNATDVTFKRDRCDHTSHNTQLNPQEPPPNSQCEDGWGEVELVLSNFGISLAADTALSVKALTNPSGAPRCPADVARLVDYARANRIGPGLLRLFCKGQKPWPAAAEAATASTVNPARSEHDLDRRRTKEARDIENDITYRWRTQGAPDAAIDAEIKRVLGLRGLEKYQTWFAAKAAEMESVS
jgi:hypothetical protein